MEALGQPQTGGITGTLATCCPHRPGHRAQVSPQASWGELEAVPRGGESNHRWRCCMAICISLPTRRCPPWAAGGCSFPGHCSP